MAAPAAPTPSLVDPTYFSESLANAMYPKMGQEEIKALASRIKFAITRSLFEKPKHLDTDELRRDIRQLMIKIYAFDVDAFCRVESVLIGRKLESDVENQNNTFPLGESSVEELQTVLIALTQLKVNICRFQTCERTAEIEKCERCKVAMYCSDRHLQLDKNRHIERDCIFLE